MQKYADENGQNFSYSSNDEALVLEQFQLKLQ